MSASEKYLRPEVIRQVGRLDLRAKFIVEGFLSSLPPRSKPTHLGTMLSVLANLRPTGETNVADSLHQLAAMVRGKSLIMIFSDLLTDPEPVMESFHHLRHRGHDLIVFHILDE